ncbi:MAG: isopeptide-forming domain-containing fimbrial protein [Eggerthellaceae bacterium]|nr:isopeptide-forming domain-containing fimbrial protein [Eggerthellaceae bacterium]
MSRIALSLLVAITMVLGLMPGAGVGKALADDARASRFAAAEIQAADEIYPLWVGETQVTSTNLKGQGWSFAPAANGNPATLTLSGYSYTGPGHVETLQDYDGEWDYYRHAPIFWNADNALVVELAGENSIVVTADPADGSASEGSDGEEDEGTTHRYCGIFCAGSLTVKGAGGLAANAGAMEDGDAGIYAKGDVSVDGGSVSATGYDYGIYSYEGTIAIGANAGTIAAETSGGAHSLHGISAEDGDVRIDGGTLTAKGYRGISAGGDIVINGGEVSAQCSVPASYTTSIRAPCAIACDYGTLTVNGGTLTAKGHQYGIYVVRYPSSGQTGLVPGIVINGGSVVVGSRESESSAIGINGCIMTVKGGSVQATGSGEKAYGVSAINSRGESGNGSLVIEKGIASFIAQGPAGAINADTSVKNAVVGFGYSDVAGTEGKTSIAANANDKDLSGYKRVLFPATAASTTISPAGKNLPYTGKPQQLVTAGAASGGAMQYSLDGKTYAAELPTATEPGEYTIYYKVAGDASHVDSQVQTVISTIAEKAYPAPTMSNSKGSAFASQTDEITYTVNQEVPSWATSVRTWVDLESVLQYAVGASDVAVTCGGAALSSDKITIDGQKLTVVIDDATALRGKTVQISYKAKLRSGAKLDSYLNAAENIASVPYQAHTSFDGEPKVVSSQVENVKFRVSAAKGDSNSAASAGGSRSGLAKTGDAVLYAVPAATALAALAAAALALAARRRTRG